MKPATIHLSRKDHPNASQRKDLAYFALYKAYSATSKDDMGRKVELGQVLKAAAAGTKQLLASAVEHRFYVAVTVTCVNQDQTACTA